ncbi:hypothetical protein [Nitrosomonas sp. Nm51]|uniref:hypothetical protein n=1 Tax=Nitrosomonas sp. Nm51 TaxID=133720 RepID=UPI00115FEC93|nr:hypothetical protein [Nitrosomonas sp. Nm51]
MARETLALSRYIPLGRTKLQILQCKIFRQALMWCIIGIDPSYTKERLAAQSRPLFRQRMTTKDASLDAFQF